MNRRLLVAATFAGVVFVGLSIALRIQLVGGSAGSAAAPPPPRAFHRLGVEMRRRPPAVPLRGADGRVTSLASYRGRWVVVLPSLTLCHEVCPLTTAAAMRLRALLNAAGAARRAVVVEVSVDPWRDSPRRLRAYRRMSGADFPMLTGRIGALRRLWRFFGVNFERVRSERPVAHDWMTGRPEHFDVEHTDGAFIIDPRGVERLAVSGMPSVGGRVEPALARLLDGAGKRNLAHPKPGWSAESLARRLEQMMRLPSGAPGGARLSGTDLAAGVAAARGRPAVVNVWASWCPPCREEMPLFATAAGRFRGRIAFLGADLEDDEGAARAFLDREGGDYQSYPTDAAEVGSLLGPVQGTPVTFFLDPQGKVLDEHIGAYRSQAELDADLIRHAS